MRYLSEQDVLATLNRGKAVETLLDRRLEGAFTIIRWVRLEKERSGQFSVTLFEVFNEGDLDHLDVYAFSAWDPDSPCGNSDLFATVEDALQFAASAYNGCLTKFTNNGVIQNEYADSIRDNR